MKVLFIGSNPQDRESLNLESEITELQQLFAEAPGEPVVFTFLPNLHIEDLPRELAKRQPDVLHISAHGTFDKLTLMNEAGSEVALNAPALAAFLPADRPPRLIYLNACESQVIAAALTSQVPMAIGTTAPITNRAARAAAVAFYERILSGSNVGQAFGVVQHMIELMQDRKASSQLHVRPGIDPNNEVLHRALRLIADFVDGDPTPEDGVYSVVLGVVGCPANTTQIIFFTDDESFIGKKQDNLPNDLCDVVRGAPVRGVVWLDSAEPWRVIGDFRMFAVGVTGDGQTFSVASTLCEAIETRYLLAPGKNVPTDITTAMTELRREDGGALDYAPARRKHMSSPRKSK